MHIMQIKLSRLRPILYLLVLLVAGLLSSCNNKTPQISIQPPLQDLGTQPQQLIDLVLLRNTGNADLVIEKVSVSCECTTAELEKSTIPPGESAELRLNLTRLKITCLAKSSASFICAAMIRITGG